MILIHLIINTGADISEVGASPGLIFGLMDLLMGAPRNMIWFPATLHAAEAVQVRTPHCHLTPSCHPSPLHFTPPHPIYYFISAVFLPAFVLPLCTRSQILVQHPANANQFFEVLNSQEIAVATGVLESHVSSY